MFEEEFMRSFEEQGGSFIVRVWLEPREIEGASPEWRGKIEHVQSGDCTYFRDLDKMVEFITNHLGGESRSALLTARGESGFIRQLIRRLLPRETVAKGNYESTAKGRFTAGTQSTQRL